VQKAKANRSRPATNTLAEGNALRESGVAEVVEKAPDAVIDAMNATLRRMHKTPPTPHLKPANEPQDGGVAAKARGKDAAKPSRRKS
jgi:hypothetical protein